MVNESSLDEPDGRSRASRMAIGGVTLACLAALVLTCFGGVLFRNRQIAFRDAGAFYYPLYLRVQQEWQAGRWPLWAPEVNAGMPLLGNPTAAVLYPGKLIYAVLPYPWAARVYAIAHLLLAFGAMGAMLRAWRVSSTGAALGALAYAFGAPVLSQTCNIIFLVGAAWAPLGFLAADRWLRLGRRGGLVGLALVLAMQVLGGDPEAAYLTVLCASGYAAGLAATRAPSIVGRLLRQGALGLVPAYLVLLGLTWWITRTRQSLTTAAAGPDQPWAPPMGVLVALAWGVAASVVVWNSLGRRGTRGFAAMMGGLIVASSLALAVSAAQVVPIIEFIRLSFRASESGPFHDVYPFSIHPLHALDAVWPNVLGTFDTSNRALIVALPPKYDDQQWVPSLYLGGLTLVLALASSGVRGGPPWRAWLTGVAVVGLLASFGEYGSPLLWARAVPGWSAGLGPLELPRLVKSRENGFLHDGDGGVYWLLASALPVFGSFRYPGKVTVFVALAVSGLAGAGWDRLVSGRSRRVAVVAGVLLAASLAALAAAWLGGAWLHARLDMLARSVGSSHGPLDVPGVIADIRASLAQGSLSMATALVLAIFALRRPRLAGMIALGALALDLGLANSRHVIAVPQAIFDEPPRVVKVIRDAEKANPAPGPFRVQRVVDWVPEVWLAHGSPSRFEEMTRWERATLRPNYGMPLGIRSTFVFDATELFDYGLFFLPTHVPLDETRAPAMGLKKGDPVWYHPRRGFDLWNTRYFLAPAVLNIKGPERGYASFVPRTTQIYPPPGAFDGPDGEARRQRWQASDDLRILRNEAAYPRAWIVHRARVYPPIQGLRQPERRKIMQEILYQNDEIMHVEGRPVHDPHLVAWVETDRPDALAPYLSRADPDPSETVTVTVDDPQRVELTAELRSPGLVVLADVYYPGWTLTVDGRPAEVLRTNRAMRGAAVTAGTHRLVFRYEPMSFRVGLAVSTLGLASLAALGVWALRSPRAASS